MPTRRALSVLTVLAMLAPLAGCGADPGLSQARGTLASATRVLTDLEGRTAEGPAGLGPDVAAQVAEPAHAADWEALRGAITAAGRRAEEASVALDIWEQGDSGDFAWRTIVPCLAQDLAEVRAHLAALGVATSVELDEALGLTSSSGERCGSRTAPVEH